MGEDKFISPGDPPKGYERELLEILAEECAEVIQRVQKAQRFGLDEIQPGQGASNAVRISEEVGDVMATIELLLENATLETADIERGTQNKRHRLTKYLQNSPGAAP